MANDTDLTVTNVDVQELSCFSSKTEPSHFQLIRVLGQGSFGKVFLVRKRVGMDTGTLFAMKVLRKASLKLRDRIRTKMERDILAAIHHPFIVRLEYAFQTEGKLYLILEYLRGGDLFSRLSREVMLPENDVKFYLAELALALNHLHQLGIIYRDLKPENILLDMEGHIKLTDFGLSKEAVHHGSGGQAFSFCGTIEYMAPEVITRRGHDSAADWWSLGVLMFEMLCGVLPFQGENRRDTMSQILRAKLRMPQFLSPDAQTLLRALFKRNPSNRLGYGPDGFESLKAQPFFSMISWSALLNRTFPAPYRPICSPPHVKPSGCSTSSCSSLMESPGVPVSASAREIFRGFSYTAPKLLDQPVQYCRDAKGEDKQSQPSVFTRSPTPAASTVQHQIGSFNSFCTEHTEVLNGSSLSAKGLSDSRSSAELQRRPVTRLPQTSNSLHTSTSQSLDLIGSSGAITNPNIKTTLFSDDYEIKEVLGRGTYATCHRCVHRRTFEVCAVKIIDKIVYDPTEEISILTRFSHLQHVVTLLAVYDSNNIVHIVTEYLGGGELLDRVMRKHGLSEFEASRLTEVIAGTLAELHKNHVVHRDLTPSNLMYAALNQDPSSLRICDFGFSKTLNSETDVLLTPRYTIPYAAPEILRRESHSYPCDMWNLGILLCVMLVGRPPYAHHFEGSPSAVINQIQKDGLKLHGPRWCKLSANAKDLVEKLLQIEPEKRISSADVLNHPWLKHREGLPRQQCILDAKEELCTKPQIQTWFKVKHQQPSAIPLLGPVSDSQLALRRQQSRQISKQKTFTIRPPKPDPLQVSPVTCTSSFVLKAPSKCTSDLALFSPLIPPSSPSSPNAVRSKHGTTTTPASFTMPSPTGHKSGRSFFTSATFTLSHSVRPEPFHSSGHTTLPNQPRVVV